VPRCTNLSVIVQVKQDDLVETDGKLCGTEGMAVQDMQSGGALQGHRSIPVDDGHKYNKRL
jgi:hypothetical protein